MLTSSQKYFRKVNENLQNLKMKFDISGLLLKSKEHDSKMDTNENKILENLEVIDTNSVDIAKNKQSLHLNTVKLNSHNSLINENKNEIDNIVENTITDINSNTTNNYNISQINKNKIDLKSDIIYNHIAAINNINSTLSNIQNDSDLIEQNSNSINSNENKINAIETKVTNNYNITQINNKDIDFETGIIDNQITAINSTLNDLKTKNNNSKYSIENFFIYNIEIENTYNLNSDNLQFSIFNYDLEDDFKKDSILEINTRLLYDYTGYNNIGKLIHNYKLYDGENTLFHEYKSPKTNAGDNLKDQLSQIDLFYVKLNKDYDKIKIELILSMIEGVTGSVTCNLYDTFNSNFLCIKYIKKN